MMCPTTTLRLTLSDARNSLSSDPFPEMALVDKNEALASSTSWDISVSRQIKGNNTEIQIYGHGLCLCWQLEEDENDEKKLDISGCWMMFMLSHLVQIW